MTYPTRQPPPEPEWSEVQPGVWMRSVDPEIQAQMPEGRNDRSMFLPSTWFMLFVVFLCLLASCYLTGQAHAAPDCRNPPCPTREKTTPPVETTEVPETTEPPTQDTPVPETTEPPEQTPEQDTPQPTERHETPAPETPVETWTIPTTEPTALQHTRQAWDARPGKLPKSGYGPGYGWTTLGVATIIGLFLTLVLFAALILGGEDDRRAGR